MWGESGEQRAKMGANEPRLIRLNLDNDSRNVRQELKAEGKARGFEWR